MDLSVLNITAAKKKQFATKGIYTVEDLLRFLPRDYYDFRNPKNIKDIELDKYECFIATVQQVQIYPKVIKMRVKDDLGTILDISFFNSSYLKNIIQKGAKYIFCGKITIPKGYHVRQCINPVFSSDFSKYKRILPIYSKINGMSDDYLQKKIEEALSATPTDEYLDINIVKDFNLMRKFEMERAVHQPKTMEEIEKAKDRLVFDELFKFSLITSNEYKNQDTSTTFKLTNTDLVDKYLKSLPYTLTDGENSQQSTIDKIFQKMSKGERTYSLIQGDVSCGKTDVALILMLGMISSGYQAALMAPTTVLALQHYLKIKDLMEPFGVKVAFLGGKMPAKLKRETLNSIKTGEAKLIIGTHSIISKSVEFKNLSLAIVDEEHRFGVVQRKLLEKKAEEGIHSITMSATPIPRSLALTIYGDFVDVYTITKMPNGRKPVKTILEENSTKAYEKMYEEIKKGHQCYVVCPLIEESDSERMQDVQSTEEATKEIIEYFDKVDNSVKVCQINGKMKQKEIDDILTSFNNKEFDIIVSTTIIEVGVNVPNATVILIKNSERFGLSTLHQLRGRVGRGNDQSYCILQSKDTSIERLKVMESTTNGFKIAEEDLKLRGMGDFIGTKQTGNNNAVMLMLSEPEKYKKIKELTIEIVKDKNLLSHYQFLIDDYNKVMGDEDFE